MSKVLENMCSDCMRKAGYIREDGCHTAELKHCTGCDDCKIIIPSRHWVKSLKSVANNMSSSSHNNTSPLTPTHQTLDRTNMKTITIYKEKPSGLYSTSEARSDDVSGAYVQFTDFVELQEKYERLQLRLKRYKNK